MSFDLVHRLKPSRRLAARLLSVCICSSLVAIRPFSRLGGTSAFLALTVQELVFSVQGTLTQQVELTILNLIFGGLFGICISTLGKYLASLLPSDSTIARTIPALFLSLTTFLGGYTKSRFPRLTLPARISGLIAVFMLTANAGTETHVLSEAGCFLWIVLTAACSSLVASMLLLRWTSPLFPIEVAACLTSIHTALQKSLEHLTSEDSGPSDRALHAKLLKQSIGLNATYRQSSFELNVGRVGVKSIKHLLGTVEHMRRELVWGMTRPPRLHPDSSFQHSLDICATKLGNAILMSLVAVRDTVLACYGRPFPFRSLDPEIVTLKEVESVLSKALESTKFELKRYCDVIDMSQRVSGGEVIFSEEIFDMCLFMISLLQMASEIRHAIHVAENCIILYNMSSLRLWHPRLTLAWLGASPSTIIMEERILQIDAGSLERTETTLTRQETREGLAEQALGLNMGDQDSESELVDDHSLYVGVLILYISFGVIQNQSQHVRHALKNSAGTVLLAVPAFMPAGSSAREWFEDWRAQWLVITYVWVLETNTGATWRVCYLRLSGTILGAIYAYVASVICRTNPYGIVTLITFANLPISYIVMNTTFPSMGVVAAITLPPVIFTPYFSEDPVSTISLAGLRALMIAMGIIAALTLNSIVFPMHSRVLFLDSARWTIGLLNQIYMELGRDLFHHGHMISNRKMLKIEYSARNSLYHMSLLLTTMNDELSLVPKPMQRYRQVAATLQKMLDILTGIRKIREHIPRHETVFAVAQQRRELVSCICICLFACEQVFAARQPLPQFLPSARQALENLNKQAEIHIRHAREKNAGALGLSLIYAFAETEALNDLVCVLEDLQNLSRQLFGTAAWFDSTYSHLTTSVNMSMQESIKTEEQSRPI